jgi:hypothetical protein
MKTLVTGSSGYLGEARETQFPAVARAAAPHDERLQRTVMFKCQVT